MQLACTAASSNIQTLNFRGDGSIEAQVPHPRVSVHSEAELTVDWMGGLRRQTSQIETGSSEVTSSRNTVREGV